MSWLSDRAAVLLAPWHALPALQTQITYLQLCMIGMETRMTSTENAAYARAAEIVGLVRAEFASLRDELDRALQGADAAVAEALEADATADADRITALVDELAAVLPADVPDVAVPGPGEAAVLPDGGTEPAAEGEAAVGETPAGEPRTDQP